MSTTTGPRQAHPRRAYDDADTPEQMVQDASACRSETHLAHAAARVVSAPTLAAGAALRVSRHTARTAIHVTDSAARFAGRLFE